MILLALPSVKIMIYEGKKPAISGEGIEEIFSFCIKSLTSNLQDLKLRA
jgi:hypothetical protein